MAVRFKQLLAQNKALTTRNDLLHREFQQLPAATSASGPATRSTSTAPAVPALAAGFPKRNVDAARQFLESVAVLGWHVHEETGALLDRRDSEMAAPGFVFALRQIVGQSS
jgi:hypothetical protein